MKLCIIAACVLFALPVFAQGPDQQQGVSGATVPIIHTDGQTPNGIGGTGATGTPGGVAITRPIPESTIQPKPLPSAETPAQLAADAALRKQADEDLTSYAEKVSGICDNDIKARIDWTTISPLQTHRYNPADACGAALQALEQICSNSAAKQRVQQEVKSVICTTGPQPSIEMHAGTLVYTIDWQSATPGERVYSWLASHL